MKRERCARCGSKLIYDAFCADVTCPFHDHYQACELGWAGHPDHPGPPTRLCTCEPPDLSVTGRIRMRLLWAYQLASVVGALLSAPFSSEQGLWGFVLGVFLSTAAAAFVLGPHGTAGIAFTAVAGVSGLACTLTVAYEYLHFWK